MSTLVLNSFFAVASLAKQLAAGETQALALDLTDNFWQPSTGHYGSAYVLDTGTPANNYDSHPYGLLTYTSPSAKMTLGPSGTLRFGAHNLYLNSASPANQSITVVSGATYSVDITGSASVTASGAATGTWTSGSNTFTAATTTLTLGSTSGSGTVVVRRTPSDSTYLPTTSAARYALPFEWDSGGSLLGLLVEEARTNLCLYSDDLTNAAWTKSNLTTAKTATGPDGVANSATTCTATAGNATALQAITSGSAARVTSVWLKRRTGSGNIDLTQDNGSTWTTKTITSSWARYDIGPTTAANPTVGIRVATSGDAVDVALFQHEVGSFPTSAAPTLGATVTRALDRIGVSASLFPMGASARTLFLRGDIVVDPALTGGGQYLVSLETDGNNRAMLFTTPGTNYAQSRSAGTTDGTAAAVTGSQAAGGSIKFAAAFAANDMVVANDGAIGVLTDSSVAFASISNLYFPSGPNGGGSYTYRLKKLLLIPRRMSDADMQTLTT